MTTQMQTPTAETGVAHTPMRRRLALGGLLVGPLLIGVGAVITPPGGEDGETLVEAARESAGAWTAGHLTVIAGAALLLVGLAALASHLPHRARTATVGVVWFALGVFGQALLSAAELVIVPIADGDRASAVAVVNRINESSGLATIFVLYLPGVLLGGLVLFVGLRLIGLLSTRVAAVGVVAVLFGFFAEDLVPMGDLVTAAALGGALYLAVGRVRVRSGAR